MARTHFLRLLIDSTTIERKGYKGFLPFTAITIKNTRNISIIPGLSDEFH